MTRTLSEKVHTGSAAAILDALAASPGEPVSGGELSRRLGLSRAAVWKRVALLKEAGFPIVSMRSHGYLLTGAEGVIVPSRIEALLKGKVIGGKIICLAETGSTNVDAARHAEEGAPEGTVVIADSQTAGKGRLGRRWESPPGRNLYCSVIIRPFIPPQKAPHLTFLSSLAICDAASDLLGLDLSLKWPNDVLAGGKKCAGLLNEMSAESDRIRYVILGIGVNLNMSTTDFPPDLRYPATSLSIESGRTIDRTLFAARLLDCLDRWYDRYRAQGFEPVRTAWMKRSWTVGKRVRVSHDGERGVTGVATGIDEMGALLVETSPGRIERILAGDVTISGGDA